MDKPVCRTAMTKQDPDFIFLHDQNLSQNTFT